jgi:hypothetical protein
VREDNPVAIGLYLSMGFVELARRTSWQAEPDRNTGGNNLFKEVTNRTARDWPDQENWLRGLYPDIINWYQPMPWKSLRPGVGPALYRFMSDYEIRHWVARVNNLPAAIVSWQAMAGRNNRLWIAIPPEGNKDTLTDLLHHARHQLAWREKIGLDFPAGLYKEAIEAAGFYPLRTLIWMKSNETSTDNNRKSI